MYLALTLPFSIGPVSAYHSSPLLYIIKLPTATFSSISIFFVADGSFFVMSSSPSILYTIESVLLTPHTVAPNLKKKSGLKSSSMCHIPLSLSYTNRRGLSFSNIDTKYLLSLAEATAFLNLFFPSSSDMVVTLLPSNLTIPFRAL